MTGTIAFEKEETQVMYGKHEQVYYLPEVRSGEYWGLGVFMLQYPKQHSI